MKRIALLIAVIALMLPTSAIAEDSSTCQAYNPQLCSSVHGTEASGTLPFTGVDVVLLAVGGAALFAAGLVVRRITQRSF